MKVMAGLCSYVMFICASPCLFGFLLLFQNPGSKQNTQAESCSADNVQYPHVSVGRGTGKCLLKNLCAFSVSARSCQRRGRVHSMTSAIQRFPSSYLNSKCITSDIAAMAENTRCHLNCFSGFLQKCRSLYFSPLEFSDRFLSSSSAP